MKLRPTVVRERERFEAALSPLVRSLTGPLAIVEGRRRARRPDDEARYQVTLRAFVWSIATIALSQIPPRNGVYMSFKVGNYVGSAVSCTALREIRVGLETLGFIVVGKHFYDGTSKSFCTRVRFTSEFRELVQALGISLPTLIDPPSEVIELKDGEGDVPPDVASSAPIIHRYNNFTRGFLLSLPPEAWRQLTRIVVRGGTNGKGDKLHRGYSDALIFLTRKFTESYERGGRLYGGFWQNMPKVIRAQLLIDSEPTVELDYSRIHPTMIFAEKGLPLDRDPYRVPGYEHMEAAGKITFNRLLNAKRAIQFRSREDREWFSNREDFKAYRDAMIEHLSPISDTFQRDYGVRLQKRDSQIAILVLSKCMDQGIPVYPVHDSFIVKQSNSDRLRIIMIESFRDVIQIDSLIK